ncbi:MAG: potassium-transporting ATPase subunit KdpA, partial [Pseudobdellovibrionaceae bacterium]
MQLESLFKVLAFYVVLGTLVPILGSYMAKVFEGKSTGLSFLKPVERMLLKFIGITNPRPMDWKKYGMQVLAFNLLGFIFLWLILLLQRWLPLNPTNLDSVPFWTAFNIAASFVTNTNWQSYVPETTLTVFSQMVGLTVQNFLSAATGICVFVALVRGLRSKGSSDVGHFWIDLNRSLVYILLPLSFVWAVVLASQGVIQNFSLPVSIRGLSSIEQQIPAGPVASQIAIKQLGTNGGGYFAANSAHPFENPTPLSNFFQVIAILLIPAALCYTFGKMVGS